VSAPKIFTPEYYARMRALESGSWWNAGMRDIASGLLSTARLKPTGRALDVGCGSGQTMTWFLGLFPEWSAWGVEIAADGVRAARESNRAVCQGSALSLPFPDHSVDLVITFDVLQHLPLGGGDGQALREMHRVLRPAGHLLARTNAQSFPYTPDDPAADFHKYQPEELRTRFERAGFTVKCLSRANAVLGLAEIPRELRAGRKEAGYHGLLSETPRAPRWIDGVKRGFLKAEGALIRRGVSLPLGRSLLALCQA
jgi:SAM-dependent methyltransferase